MQKPVELANKILSVLEKENPYDAIRALKIAMILSRCEVIPSTLRNEYPEVRGESALEVQ